MFWLFIFGSIFGWVLEGVFSLIVHGVFINHSALVIGPFNICYGICACSLTFLLYKFKDKGYIKLFFISFIIGSILEYIMSWGMELVMGFSAWDYSDNFLNINGRVCLLMSFFWGIRGIAWIKILYPHVEKLINKTIEKTGKNLIIVIIVFLIFDMILTISAVVRAREKENGLEPRNAYERLLDKTFNKDYLYNMYNNNWS